MILAMTVTPSLPLLSAALWMASVAVTTRSACHLAVLAFTRRDNVTGRVIGWQGLAFGLVSATLASVGNWGLAAVLGVMAGACGVLWRRERNSGEECA